jgi:DNA topoisomerase I
MPSVRLRVGGNRDVPVLSASHSENSARAARVNARLSCFSTLSQLPIRKHDPRGPRRQAKGWRGGDYALSAVGTRLAQKGSFGRNARKGLNLLVESPDSAQAIVDPRDAAESAGLRYVSDDRPGIRRKKAGSGFIYTRANGSRLAERDALKRIKALAIPPAWTDVWICPFADGHIQVTGRDAKGRKQCRYHPRFREVRESTKYEHVVAFADKLPSIRDKVREHMGLRGLPREKVLATVVHLLETTLIRAGNDDYAKQNNSYGLTTLKNRRRVDGNEVHFRFTGKSDKQWSLRVRDRRVAKIIRALRICPDRS